MNIYELPQAVNEAMEKYLLNFNQDTGEEETDSTEALKQLEELQNQKDELIEWMLKKRGNAEANKKALSDEVSRLSERMKREDKTIEQMENMVRHFIPTIDKPLTISNWTVSYRKSKKTIIENKDLIPEEYRVTETITTEKIPLDAIKKAIEEGKEVPGAFIQENSNLYIK